MTHDLEGKFRVAGALSTFILILTSRSSPTVFLMAPALSPNLKLTMADIERKVDMSLDDIIKLSKQKKPRRAPIKSSNGKLAAQSRRDTLQRSVALRSSAIRQGKLAEARARGGNSALIATKAAARRASSTAVTQAVKGWGRKAVQGFVRPFPVASKNVKISVPNRVSKNGGNRRPLARWTSILNKGTVAPSQRPTWGSNKVIVSSRGREVQTLDSRFASMREERQLHSYYSSRAAWRR